MLRNIANPLALIALLAHLTDAHTWIEQYQVIGPNGSYIGDNGYSRGYVARTDPTFQGDANILWMLPELSAREPNGDVRNRINATDLLCHPNQRTSNYTDPSYPKLKVSPGSYVAMKYFENGHVTLPWNQPGKPPKGGTVFVYGTTSPVESETLSNVLRWTRDGRGGDGRGALLAAQTFDDGRCHQINNCLLSAERQVRFPNHVTGTNTSAELWCETDLFIPRNQKVGQVLTTYWVWQWPTEPGTSCTYPEGKDEYYTTCADFDVVEASHDDAGLAKFAASNTLLQQDFQTAAVSSFADREVLTASPSVTLNDWSTFSAQLAAATAKPSGGEAGKFLAACSVSNAEAVAAASAGEVPGLPASCPAGKWATGELFGSISSSVVAEMGRTGPASVTASATASATGAGMGSAMATATAASSGVLATSTGFATATGTASAGSTGAGAVISTSTAAAAVTTSSTGSAAAAESSLLTSSGNALPSASASASATGLVTYSTGSATVTAPPTTTGSIAANDKALKAQAMSTHCASMMTKMKRRHARDFR